MAEEEENVKRDDNEPRKTVSYVARKELSKTGISSKSSFKKISTSSSLTDSRSISLNMMKRLTDGDKIVKGPRYQNTYRLDPTKPFKFEEVHRILEKIVLKEIEEYPNYDAILAPKLIQTIALEVRNSVRALNYDRYKICVLVYLGEKKFQGFLAAFRSLWDYERDSWATYYYQCKTYFISCTCYGLYHD